eukprot:scaffold150416_cov30-Tisochrysis_lutea.AAC.3
MRRRIARVMGVERVRRLLARRFSSRRHHCSSLLHSRGGRSVRTWLRGFPCWLRGLRVAWRLVRRTRRVEARAGRSERRRQRRESRRESGRERERRERERAESVEVLTAVGSTCSVALAADIRLGGLAATVARARARGLAARANKEREEREAQPHRAPPDADAPAHGSAPH